MAFPPHIAEILRRHPTIGNNREFTQNYICQGARFHSPTPLEVHRVLIGRTAVRLCGVCRDNLGLLTELLEAENEKLAWPTLREFGSGIRELLKKRTQDG